MPGNMKFGGLALLVVATCLTSVEASKGDRDPRYTNCLERCLKLGCEEPLGLNLVLLGWGCDSNCRYECMHKIEFEKILNANPYPEPVQQYYGKWPFIRVLGMQEVASVVFSLMNLYVHLHGHWQMQTNMPAKSYLKPVYKYIPWVGMNAWLWSTVFHARDVPWTEILDYFSAIFG